MSTYYSEQAPIFYGHISAQTLNEIALIRSTCCHQPDPLPVSGDMIANIRTSDELTGKRLEAVATDNRNKHKTLNTALAKLSLNIKYGRWPV